MSGFRLIAITPPYIYKGEAEQIEKALFGRFSRVHIRKPDAPDAEMRELLARIAEELRPRISLHDHHHLAKEYGIGGLHLNSRNPTAPDDWDGSLSMSAHTPDEALKAAGRERYDYVMLSPVAPSLSKPGYRSQYSFEQLAVAASEKVVALGGVTDAILPMLEEAGFGGAAMLTSAWQKPLDPEAFRLQFITHPATERDVTEGARLALEGGCRWIQLRHKDADHDTLLKEGLAIAALCRQHGATFIIDDHVELVEATGADGVHLGKNDMPVAEARRRLGPSVIIGATANTAEELEAAAKAGADYAGVGPFRFTTTKEKLAPTLGVAGYEEIIRRKNERGIRIPVVAIGGITKQDIAAILHAGTDGIAASGSILTAADPAEATREIIVTINNAI